MKKLLAIILLVQLWMNTMASTDIQPLKFTHYTTENGLPSNTVRSLAQDSEGFIWFATDGGLVRFDGISCTTFLPPSDSRTEAETYILSVCSTDDTLLAGSDRQLYVFNKRKEALEPADVKYPADVKSFSGKAVNFISGDNKGQIWVSVEEDGIYRLDSRLNVKGRYTFPEIPDLVIQTYCDRHGTIWAVSASANGGVYRFNPGKDKFEKFPVRHEGKEVHVPSFAIFEDVSGNYWLGTWDDGLLRFNPSSGEVISGNDTPCRGKIYHIHSIAQHSPSTLMIGSGIGLALFDTTSGKYTLFKNDELDVMSLSNQFVYPVLEDSEGGFWIGTYYGGVNYLRPDTKHIMTWRHSRFSNSISGNLISCLCEDTEGNIWIGSDDGGLCRYSPSTGTFRHYPLSRDSGSDNVHALCHDGNRLWVGTYSSGAGYLDIASGTWHFIPLIGEKGLYSSYAIHKDRHGNIWMTSFSNLYRYDPAKNAFVKVADLGVWVLDMEEDSEDRIWMASQGKGILIFDPGSKKITSVRAGEGPNAIPDNHVNDLSSDHKGNIYISTVKGGAVYSSSDRIFKTIDVALPNRYLSSITPIGDDIWFATTSGLLKLNSDGKTESFDRHDGLAGNQFTSGTSLLASDGRLYLGTVNGLSSLRPSDVNGNSFIPSIKFTGLEIAAKSIATGCEKLPESLNTISRLVLGPEDYMFTVHFSALSFANPQCNSYRYKLEGFDKDWIDGGNRGSATYSNLPPGRYTLKVMAANNDGIWNPECATLSIEMSPPWYASIWMKIVYLLLLIGGIAVIVGFERRKKEQLYKKELERISDNKTKEVYRAKLKFFTIVAHEIRTPVSLIIGPLEKIMQTVSKMPADIRDDLKIIDRNSRRLLSLVNQMLDFKKVEDSELPAVFRHERIVPLVDEVAERFRPSLQHKGVTLTTVYPDVNLMADVCAESFTKLVSNLINNARKFTSTIVTVECRQTDSENFMIAVSDDGIGIRKENIGKIFTPFYQIIDNINESKGGTGLGLSIVKGITETHHGSVRVESEPGKGSRFIVTLPVRQEAVRPAEEKSVVADEEIPPRITEKIDSTAEEKDVMLVVDDNEEMRAFISSHFRNRYEVIDAENGKEALKLLKERHVSVIICDWMMPVMDGAELLKKMRIDNSLSHIPFVMLTAKTDSGSKIEGFRSGTDAYVEKPFSINVLEARVNGLLDMRRLLREKYSSTPLEPISTIAPNPQDNEFLGKMNAIIEENFSNPELSVDFLAARLGISRSGFYSKIKVLADVTPNEIIQITRLKKAAKLLKEKRYRISEISFMVGFNSSSYFSKCFQKQFGLTPGRFLEKLQENGQEVMEESSGSLRE